MLALIYNNITTGQLTITSNYLVQTSFVIPGLLLPVRQPAVNAAAVKDFLISNCLQELKTDYYRVQGYFNSFPLLRLLHFSPTLPLVIIIPGSQAL